MLDCTLVESSIYLTNFDIIFRKLIIILLKPKCHVFNSCLVAITVPIQKGCDWVGRIALLNDLKKQSAVLGVQINQKSFNKLALIGVVGRRSNRAF